MKNIKANLSNIFFISLLTFSLNGQSSSDVFQQSMDDFAQIMKKWETAFDVTGIDDAQPIVVRSEGKEIICEMNLQGLNPDDMRADVFDGKFTLFIKNDQLESKVNITEDYLEAYIYQIGRKESKDKDNNSSQNITSSVQSLSRSLPHKVSLDEVSVEYNNDMLMIHLPIKEPKTIPVKITVKEDAKSATEKVEVELEKELVEFQN